jgi:hypothetical protein
VAIDRNVRTINDIRQLPNSRFFTWMTDADYDIGRMQGVVHCEIYEAFKACKYLNIGVSYAANGSDLQIFPNEDFLKPEEDREPIFSGKDSSVKAISKYISEHKRDDYFKLMQQNKYRSVVQQTLIDQPISNFINANCKAPFSHALFRFTVKARNQCLMTNFMRKLIFHDGNGVCGLCPKDRQDTVYHILNECDGMAGDYTTRHNLIVNRLVEAIKLNYRIIGEVNENTTVKITSTEGKNDKPFHSQIRPDIWYWTNEATDDPVPEHQRILHLVEVKPCWGGVYDDTIDKEGGNTIDERR